MIRPLSVAAIGLFVALTLSACATTPHPSAPAGQPPVAPTPTATRALAPEPRVGTTCARLVGVEELQAQLLKPIRVRTDDMHVDDFSDAVLRQAGGLRCAWGGDDRTDSMYDTGMTMSLLPDAAEDYARYRASQYFEGDAAGTGLGSGVHCNAPSPICVGDVLVGTTWLSFTYSDEGRTGDVTPAVVDLLTRMAARIGESSASSWSPPPASLDELPCTAAAATTILGSPATARVPEAEDGNVLFDAVVALRDNVRACSWSTGDGGPTAGLQLLPGGAWALAPMTASGAGWPLIGVPTRTAPAGTDGALQGCGDTCLSAISLRGSLVSFDSFPPDAPTFEEQLARIGGVLAG